MVTSILGTAFLTFALDARETTTVAHFFGVTNVLPTESGGWHPERLGCPRADFTSPTYRFLKKN
jgi:hypothetical protein